MHIQPFAIPRMLAGLVVAAGVFASGLHAQEPEVLTRGPVHEAFAGTVEFDPEIGATVNVAPPEPIDEVPPDQQPDGDNVTWIPGYWAWDEETEDFLWISGVWRNLPPGREWVPGYWAEDGNRYQWTSGYWEDEEVSEVSYLPAPPKSQERGPNVEAPSNSHTWIPGNWVYQQDNYSWRPGYWAPGRDDWAWTPAYYRWTPRGYTYVDGYWDYPVERRGVVFAPVRIQREYYARPDYSYSPVTAIAVAVFANHLFVRPSHNHYYFGDYYEPRYRDRGYFASYDYYSRRRGYDPIYARYRWENRNDRDWDRGRREYFEYRRDHVDARPPRTWRALDSRPYSDRERRDFGVAERYDRMIERGDGKQRFRRVSADEKTRYVSQRQEIRNYGKERAKMESRRDLSPGNDRKVVREKVKKSPVLAKNGGRAPERLQARASEKDPRTGQGGKKGDDQARREETNNRGDGSGRGDGVKGKPENGKAEGNRGEAKKGNDGKADNNRGDANKGNNGKADNNRGDGNKSKGDGTRGDGVKGKSGQGGETRTAPGQRREPSQKADNNQGKKNDAPARNTNAPKKEASNGGNKQNASPERREAPKKQQAQPTPKKQQANPAPKRQENSGGGKKESGRNNDGGGKKEQSAAPKKQQQQTASVRKDSAPKRQQAANAPKRQQVAASAPTKRQQVSATTPKRQQQKASNQQASRPKAASSSGNKSAARSESKKDSGKGNKKEKKD